MLTGMDKLSYVQMIACNNAVQSSYAHHSGENVTGVIVCITCRCVCWGEGTTEMVGYAD